MRISSIHILLGLVVLTLLVIGVVALKEADNRLAMEGVVNQESFVAEPRR